MSTEVTPVPCRHGYNFHESPWAAAGSGGAGAGTGQDALELKQAQEDEDHALRDELAAATWEEASEARDVILLLDESRERWRLRHSSAAEELHRAMAEAASAEAAVASVKEAAFREQEALLAPMRDLVTVLEEARNRWQERCLQAQQERDQLEAAHLELLQLEQSMATQLREAKLQNHEVAAELRKAHGKIASGGALEVQKKAAATTLDAQDQLVETKERLRAELSLQIELTTARDVLQLQQEEAARALVERVHQESEVLRQEHAELEDSRAALCERNRTAEASLQSQLCQLQQESRCREEQHTKALSMVKQDTHQFMEERAELCQLMSSELSELQDAALHRWRSCAGRSLRA